METEALLDDYSPEHTTLSTLRSLTGYKQDISSLMMFLFSCLILHTESVKNHEG